MCHAVVNVNGEELAVEAGKLQVVDSNLAGATLGEMTEGERSVIHNIWANPWIGFQVKVDGVWEDIPADARQEPFSSLMEDALLRVKPSADYLEVLRKEVTKRIVEARNSKRTLQKMAEALALKSQEALTEEQAAIDELLDLA